MNIPKLVMASAFTLFMMGPVAAQPAGMAQGGDPSQWSNRLHSALRLRPDQEGAWRTFEQASMPSDQEDARRQDTFQRMGQMRAPQRMDLSIQMMRSDLQDMERRADALKTFYATLSPDQQATFDRETMRPPQ